MINYKLACEVIDEKSILTLYTNRILFLINLKLAKNLKCIRTLIAIFILLSRNKATALTFKAYEYKSLL